MEKGKPFSTVQQGERQPKGMMWFRSQYVPILYSRGRTDGFLGKDWVARGTTQRIGASIFAIVFFCSSVALFVAGSLIGAKTSQDMDGIVGQISGIVLAALAFLVACFVMFLTFRLVRCIVRSFQK